MNETLPQSWAAPDRPKPIVIFGAGSITRDAHLPAYAKGGYHVAGIFDPDTAKARTLADEHGCTAFASLQEAAEVPDAVFDLATPPAAHGAVLRALPRGAAALVQKPFGSDLSAATELLDICRAQDLLVGVNFQLRFAPMMIALKAAIDRGDLGQIVDVEVHGVMGTPWHLWSFLDGLPRIEITMHSIHYLDLIRHLVGAPRGVFARTLGHPSHKVAQTRTSAILDYGPDLRCTMSINHDWSFGPDHQVCEMRVGGTEGAAFLQMGVNLDYPKGAPDILRINSKREGWRDVPLTGAWFPDAFVGRMHNLQRAAAGLEPLISDASDGWQTMALVEACYAASLQPATRIEDLP